MKASPVASEEPTFVEGAKAAHGEGGRHHCVGASEPKRRGRTMRARRNSDDAHEHGDGTAIDANAIVAYNLRVIRERHGWTQEGVAEHLGRLTGHQLSQAAISAMERGFDGQRPRRFDAHDLYLFSVVFGVPIAYFFIPPLGQAMARQVSADTGRPVGVLVAAFLGRAEQVLTVDEWRERVHDAASLMANFVREIRAARLEAFFERADHSDDNRDDHAVVGVDDPGAS